MEFKQRIAGNKNKYNEIQDFFFFLISLVFEILINFYVAGRVGIGYKGTTQLT